MAVTLVLPSVPAGAAAAARPEERREDIAQELERLREEVDETVAEEAGVLAELEVTRRAKEAVGETVADLDAGVAGAELDLADAEAGLIRAGAARAAAERRLRAVQIRLDGSQEIMEDQAVSRFMRSGVEAEALDVLLQVRDVGDLHEAATLMGAAARSQADVIRRHQALQQRTAGLRAQAEEARLDASRRRDEVVGQKQALEAARAEQAAALVQVAVEEDREEELLDDVQETKDDYEQRIVDLRDESESITALLVERQRDQVVAARPGAAPSSPRTSSTSPASSSPASSSAASPSPRSSSAGSPTTTSTTTASSSSASSEESGQLAYPLANAVVTSRFGFRTHPIFGTRRLHAGTDFRGATGTPVLAAAGGTVVSAGPRGGYGNAVIIDHGGALATLYAHQSRLSVVAGDQVETGQVIGAVGSTGYSTGPHLHFEVRVNGTPVDPLNYL